MRIEHRLTKNNFIFGLILALSFTGLVIMQSGATAITLFYPLGILLIFSRLLALKKFSKNEAFLGIWGVSVFVASLILDEQASMLSTGHFLFYLMIGIAFIGMNVSRSLESALKTIITLNFYNVVVAFILNMLSINNDFLSKVFITYFNRGSLRFCGFTSEPSYLAMILTLSILSLVFMNDKLMPLKKWIVYYALTIIISKSSFGLLSLLVVAFIILTKIWDKQKSNTKFIVMIISVFLGIVALWVVIQIFINFDYLSRIIKIIGLIFTSTSLKQFVSELRIVDSSAWHRVGPTLGMFSEMNFLDIRTWFGHGIGTDVDYFTKLVAENTVMRLGFIPTAFYNFGIIGATSLLWWIIKICRTTGVAVTLYTVLCFTNCSFSTQAFWFIVLVIFWNKRTKRDAVV